MRLITGDKLSADTRREVLARFVHRWTHENARQTHGGKCPGCEQSGNFPRHAAPKGQIGRQFTREEWHAHHTPLVSDAEWLATHAFHVTQSGRLSNRHSFAEPAYMAETEAARV